jgi:hypothetical protein
MTASPRKAAMIAVLFLASLAVTAYLTSAYKGEAYEARHSEYRYQTDRRHRAEINELQGRLHALEIEMARAESRCLSQPLTQP